MIIEAIDNNSDGLRLYFGCKALRKILSIGSEEVVRDVLLKSKGLGKRLVQLLTMPQKYELQIEICWALLNLTSLKDTKGIKGLVEFGLFDTLIKLIDDNLELH